MTTTLDCRKAEKMLVEAQKLENEILQVKGSSYFGVENVSKSIKVQELRDKARQLVSESYYNWMAGRIKRLGRM